MRRTRYSSRMMSRTKRSAKRANSGRKKYYLKVKSSVVKRRKSTMKKTGRKSYAKKRTSKRYSKRY